MEKEVIHTKIWQEEPEADNPFAAAKCYCSGYDVYGEILEKSSWAEYLYLLFKLEKPEPWQATLIEKVAIAIANPGIRDHSVRAAMNAGVGGSTSASALMAALAVGAGQYGGAREVYACINRWEQCKQNLNLWEQSIEGDQNNEQIDGWPRIEHPPGFDPNSIHCANPVLQTLAKLASIHEAKCTNWLYENRVQLEKVARMPLAMTSVISCALYDLGLNAEQSEIIFLILRLPGAAAHALEQKQLGWKKYPFYLDKYSVE